MVTETRTTCPYCGVGCGVLVRVEDDGRTSVQGDPDHPANFGRLCSKGSALAETLGDDGRIHHPEIGGRQVGWDEALDLVAGTFAETIAEHGPEAVAFYLSGQLLTEDYYVANKLMKGFIGAANIDTNSRLCMASSVAGHRRAFGSDTVPGNYEDIEQADLVVIVGSNMAWCHPVLYQRLAAAKAARPEMVVVVIDPRRTATSDIADLHLSVRADGDVALFNGLLTHLHDNGWTDLAFVAEHTAGLDAALTEARQLGPSEISEITGLLPQEIAAFYERFAGTEKVVTLFSQGVNQSSSGSDKVNAIINCHLLTGRIGRPGMGPLSLTGQPNAMGGREVGGLANMLAAHMNLDSAADRDRVGRFWSAPEMADRPGLKAVDLVRGGGRRPRQGAVDHGDQPGRLHARRRPGAGGHRSLPLRRRLRHSTRHRYGAARPCAAAVARLEREIRHRHQFRAAHLSPARLPRRAGRGAGRLVAVCRGRPPHGFW